MVNCGTAISIGVGWDISLPDIRIEGAEVAIDCTDSELSIAKLEIK